MPGYYVLDSYNSPKPGTNGEIVSRKFTQLSEIQQTTALRYLEELAYKYPPGAVIADVGSTPSGLAGKQLDGILILEVPVQVNPVPQAVLDSATMRGITIRDVNGTVYNP